MAIFQAISAAIVAALSGKVCMDVVMKLPKLLYFALAVMRVEVITKGCH